MPAPESVDKLIQAFVELGAEEPERWAASQLKEGIPQLARCSVLRALWDCVVTDDERSLQESIARVLHKSSEATTWHLMDSCLRLGVSITLMHQLVRSVQIDVLQNATYPLSGSPLAPSVSNVAWGIFQTDEQGRPFGPQVSSLYESFISLDPTGREGGSRVA